MSSRRLLIVTNDFPPRQGGIQSFVYELARRLPADQLAVYASDHPGSKAFDAEQDFPVRRHPGGLLIPTPRARRLVLQARQDFGSTAVWFGASAPLGLLASALRRAGVRRMVASTHGHEAGWAMLPGARQALRRIGNQVDVVTYLADYTWQRLAGAFGPHAGHGQADPRGRHRRLPAGGVRRRGPAAARPGRPSGGGVRVSAGAPQGPGRADPGDAGDRRSASKRRRC